MADQKEMKKRLKVLMQKQENQICSDCPERQPRWASLIVPPPGSPPGSSKIGAFCCLECSGSHRRLGVHISFVRSINLDSWKEAEVLAMENGGNRKVNVIWEANLQRAGGRKPTTGADLATRERYVRDKYERRKFYDPQALAEYQNQPEPDMADLVKPGGADFANFADAPISDAAKLRAMKKGKKQPIVRKKSFEKSFEAPARTKSSGSDVGAAGRRRMKRQDSQPQAPMIDLLDLGAVDPAPPAATTNGTAEPAPFADFFSPEATTNGAPPAAAAAAPQPTGERPRRRGSRDGVADGSRSRSTTRGDSRTKSRTPDREKTRKNQDILNMYHTPLPGAVAPGVVMPGAALPNNNANPMMAMMQQMQLMNNPQAMQQQQPGFGGMVGQQQQQPDQSKHNSRLAMHQNLMMQQMQAQMQQQQRNAQQVQRMMHQQGGAAGMNPQMMAQMNPQMMAQMNPQMMAQMAQMNPQMMQAMMQQNQNNNMGGGMPPQVNTNMMMGMNPNMSMGMSPNMVQQQQAQQQQMNQFGGGSGMASPMGGAVAANKNAVPEKEDPFAQFGMNAFR